MKDKSRSLEVRGGSRGRPRGESPEKSQGGSRSLSRLASRPPAVQARQQARQQAYQQAYLAHREIVLWTTKDGREIPIDDMTDEHIANALRVLSLWRVRLKKKDPDNPVIRDLGEAISRFKSITRRRKKDAQRTEKAADRAGGKAPARKGMRQIGMRRG